MKGFESLGFKDQIQELNNGRSTVMTAGSFLVIKTDYDFLVVQRSRGNQVYQQKAIYRPL